MSALSDFVGAIVVGLLAEPDVRVWVLMDEPENPKSDIQIRTYRGEYKYVFAFRPDQVEHYRHPSGAGEHMAQGILTELAGVEVKP